MVSLPAQKLSVISVVTALGTLQPFLVGLTTSFEAFVLFSNYTQSQLLTKKAAKSLAK